MISRWVTFFSRPFFCIHVLCLSLQVFTRYMSGEGGRKKAEEERAAAEERWVAAENARAVAEKARAHR